ncbi:MAG: preprotein translocase subunit SecE [Candidatus Sericytochromatia bacterium]
MAKATNKESAKDQKDKDSKVAPAKKDSKKDAKKKGKDNEELSSPQQLQQFIKDSWVEFRKIQWPTPRQAANESIVVLLTVIFVIALVRSYDWISNFILGFILVK